MALATRKSGNMHSKTGSDLLEMKSKYDNNRAEEYVVYEEIGSIMYQIQLLKEDIDELRRYVTSSELLLPDTMGDSLPSSDPSVAGQLYKSAGALKVSRG
jgi:hypothetical protein